MIDSDLQTWVGKVSIECDRINLDLQERYDTHTDTDQCEWWKSSLGWYSQDSRKLDGGGWVNWRRVGKENGCFIQGPYLL